MITPILPRDEGGANAAAMNNLDWVSIFPFEQKVRLGIVCPFIDRQTAEESSKLQQLIIILI
jgi:hypothetical protein